MNYPVDQLAPTWDTPDAARHNVRVLCDRAGLSFYWKNVITACIQQESGFDNTVTCKNRLNNGTVWSTDWGICQINDYWNIGSGKPFPSVQYVLNNPGAVVGWMIQMQKAGNLHLWASYSSGAYLRYMPKA